MLPEPGNAAKECGTPVLHSDEWKSPHVEAVIHSEVSATCFLDEATEFQLAQSKSHHMDEPRFLVQLCINLFWYWSHRRNKSGRDVKRSSTLALYSRQNLT